MAVLLDLLLPYPVLENLASSLALGDLFNLSKANAAYRAALHGFAKPLLDRERDEDVRSMLQIGEHRSAFWENLKARSQLECSEPQHTRGSNPSGCRLCSMPVCEACIIKASFAKRSENTFQNRHRSLCADCWTSGNRHKKQPVGGSKGKSYHEQALEGCFCVCAAKDGHLCLKCKTYQNSSAEADADKCYGQGCLNGSPKSKAAPMEGRICLWCSRQLPGSRSRAESRRDYDARHILARSHSSYDRPPEEEDFDSFEEQRMLELDALSRRKKAIASGTAVEIPDPSDSTERSGLVDSPETSAYSKIAQENERWERSEATRAPAMDTNTCSAS